MSLLIPTAFAQSTFQTVKNNPTFVSLIGKITDAIITPVLQGMIVLAGLVFIWGVVEMIRNADDSAAHEKGQQHMLWGVIGFAIMASAYGILRVIINTVCPDGSCDPFL